MTCTELLSPQPSLAERTFSADQEGIDAEYDYLVMLMEFESEPKVAEYKAKKWGYEEAINFKPTDEDVRVIIVRFIKHNMTSVVRSVLERGHEVLLNYALNNTLGLEESVALSLTTLHKQIARNGNSTLLASALESAINTLKPYSNEPLAAWHLAELLYKQKDYQTSKELLTKIINQSETPSEKTLEALGVVETAIHGESHLNVLEHSSFDHTQWGPYAE